MCSSIYIATIWCIIFLLDYVSDYNFIHFAALINMFCGNRTKTVLVLIAYIIYVDLCAIFSLLCVYLSLPWLTEQTHRNLPVEIDIRSRNNVILQWLFVWISIPSHYWQFLYSKIDLFFVFARNNCYTTEDICTQWIREYMLNRK